MSTAVATEQRKHRHIFKVKYKLIDNNIFVQSICCCAGCAMQARITLDGHRVSVTFVGNGSDVSYTAVLAEDKP